MSSYFPKKGLKKERKSIKEDPRERSRRGKTTLIDLPRLSLLAGRKKKKERDEPSPADRPPANACPRPHHLQKKKKEGEKKK